MRAIGDFVAYIPVIDPASFELWSGWPGYVWNAGPASAGPQARQK